MSYLRIPGFHVHISVPLAPDINFGWDGVDLGAGLDIPKLAAGGVVTRPTLLVAGEAGPEAIIPLDRYAAIRTLTSPPAAAVPQLPPLAAAVGGLRDVVVFAQFGDETIEARSVRITNRVLDARIAGADLAYRNGTPGGALGALSSPHAVAASR